MLLSCPSPQVAIELLGLAATMGLRSWRSATHNGRPFRLLGSSKLAIPQRGRLHVEFASCVPALRREAGAPLSDEEVMAMWFELADPDEKYRPEVSLGAGHGGLGMGDGGDEGASRDGSRRGSVSVQGLHFGASRHSCVRTPR